MTDPAPEGEAPPELPLAALPEIEQEENVEPFAGILDCLLKPAEYFSAMPGRLGYGPPLARVAVWAVFASLTGLALRPGGIDWSGVLDNPWSLPLYVSKGTLFQLAATFLSGGVFHVLCKLMGGKAGYQASFRVVAALAVLGPLLELGAVVPFYGLASMSVVSLYYWAVAAVQVHGVRPKIAYAFFGLLALGVLGLSLLNAVL